MGTENNISIIDGKVVGIPDDYMQEYDGGCKYSHRECCAQLVDKSVRYIVVQPEKNMSSKMDVMYMIPGLGGNAREWVNYGACSILHRLTDEKVVKEMVCIIPYIEDCKGIAKQEVFHNFDTTLIQLVDYIKNRSEIKDQILKESQNTHIVGLSYGAKTSLYIGYKYPDVFGNVGSFGASPGLLDVIDDKGHLVEKGWIQPTSQYNYALNQYVFISKGVNDGVVGLFPEFYDSILLKHGCPHIFCYTDGAHDREGMSKGLYTYLIKKI